jgi:hypothetical protein
MTSIGWSLVETTAQLLEFDQREAVLGDLIEAGETAWQSLVGIISLLCRKQAALWTNWRPWLAAFGVTLPASFLLMGVSLSVIQDFVSPSGSFKLISQLLLLLGWSWSGGFVVGMLSRRTLWMSIVLCCSPCLFCLARFRVPSLSRFCLLLFLLPAACGVIQGLRKVRFKPGSTFLFALTITLLMIATANSEGHLWWSPRPWILGATLSCPAWYLVATARQKQDT